MTTIYSKFKTTPTVIALLLAMAAFGWSLDSCHHAPYIGITNPADTTVIHDTTNHKDTTHVIPPSPCSPDSVYFTKQVLPVLNSYCGSSGCHDGKSLSEHNFNLTTYAGVMASGLVNNANPSQRRLYTGITGGSDDRMPPSSKPQLTQSQIDLILKWIQQGSKDLSCDQCDTTNITFALTINPIIQNACLGCHSAAAASGNVRLQSYSDIARLATSVGDSLVNAVFGLHGFHSMPPNSSLDSCDLTKIRIWSRAGAPNN